MIVKIKRDNDPFKKYWWALLLGFALTGAWICIPLMGTQTGAGVALREGGLQSAEQSLDSIHNPSGAPGSIADLNMEGSGAYAKKKTDGPITSSLYQPLPEEKPAPAATPPAAASPGNLADALKDISRRSASASSSGNPNPFNPSKANFGSLSGLGGSSASNASVSSSYSGGSSGLGLTPFAAGTPNTGVTTTRGLDGAQVPARSRAGTMGALQDARVNASLAMGQRSYDGAAAISGQTFDGRSGAGSPIGGGVALGGSYAKLDAAPKNLKANDPNLSTIKIEPPPAVPKIEPEDRAKQMMEMIMMMVVGGVVSGVMGGIMK